MQIGIYGRSLKMRFTLRLEATGAQVASQESPPLEQRVPFWHQQNSTILFRYAMKE